MWWLPKRAYHYPQHTGARMVGEGGHPWLLTVSPSFFIYKFIIHKTAIWLALHLNRRLIFPFLYTYKVLSHRENRETVGDFQVSLFSCTPFDLGSLSAAGPPWDVLIAEAKPEGCYIYSLYFRCKVTMKFFFYQKTSWREEPSQLFIHSQNEEN